MSDFIGPQLNEATRLQRTSRLERKICLENALNPNWAWEMSAWDRKIAHEEAKRLAFVAYLDSTPKKETA